MINPIQNLKAESSKNFSVQMPLQSFYSTQLSNLDPRILQSFENNQCLSFISLLNREFPFNYQISIRLESGKCFLYVKTQSNLMHICAKCILLGFNKYKEYKQVIKSIGQESRIFLRNLIIKLLSFHHNCQLSSLAKTW